jgi:hypothetical protein
VDEAKHAHLVREFIQTIGVLLQRGEGEKHDFAVPTNSLVYTAQPDKKKACEETTSSSWMSSAGGAPLLTLFEKWLAELLAL